MKTLKLSGLIPPMVTPLDEKRRLDKKGTKNMVNHLLKGGVDGIFLLGTTGEGPHLSYAIRRALVGNKHKHKSLSRTLLRGGRQNGIIHTLF